MKKIFHGFVPMFFAVLLVTGCAGTPPVLDISGKNISASAPLSIVDVGNAISAAGSGLGWNMQKVKDGEIKADIALRKHTASVLITYTTDSYDIKYIDSTNLRYDESGHTIHKNYNGWIQNLERAIDRSVSSYIPSATQTHSTQVYQKQSAPIASTQVAAAPMPSTSTSSGSSNGEASVSGTCNFSFTGTLMSGRTFKATQTKTNMSKTNAVNKAISVLSTEGINITTSNTDAGLVSGVYHGRQAMSMNLIFTNSADNTLSSQITVAIPSGFATSADGMKQRLCGILGQI